MGIILRQYQEEMVDAGVRYMLGKSLDPSIIVGPVASGKSIVPAEIIKRTGRKMIMLQPSQELLIQNIEKARALGLNPTIYSASLKTKELSGLTYATLGSIIADTQKIREMGIKDLILDECHYKFSTKQEEVSRTGRVKQKSGQFLQFAREIGVEHVLGLTASPFNLSYHTDNAGDNYSQLDLLIYKKPKEKFFKKFLHIVQIQDIMYDYWSIPKYEVWKYNGSILQLNKMKSEYTEESISLSNASVKLNNEIYKRILELKDTHNHILVFMDTVENCNIMSNFLNKNTDHDFSRVVSGDTDKKEREDTIDGFKSGHIKVVFCYGTLSTGFDFPELDCVIMGRPTFSLNVWYQIAGRIVRPLPDGTEKDNCLIVDCCDNYSRFGPIENLRLEKMSDNRYHLLSGNKVLSGVPMGSFKDVSDIGVSNAKYKESLKDPLFNPKYEMLICQHGAYSGYFMKNIPARVIWWTVKNKERNQYTECFFKYAGL